VPTKGLDRFQRTIITIQARLLKARFRDKKKARLLGKEIEKQIFNLGPPKPPHTPTPRERYFHSAFIHFTEIMRCVDTLGDIEFYLGRFPYSDGRIKRHRHLQFLAEAYLHEMYICEERLLLYLTFIERQFKKDSRLPHVKTICDLVKKTIRAALNNIRVVRGSHVHRTRFSDNELERLNAIDLALVIPYTENRKIANLTKKFYLEEYRKARKNHRQVIKKANEDLRKLLDFYFDALFPIFFDDQGDVSYPSRLNSKSLNRVPTPVPTMTKSVLP
jgi:hypothetical protein